MPFELNQVTLIYLFAAVATILLVEALYLAFFSTTSYKTTVNRRMRLMREEPNRENILVQLRRERSLTSGGDYSLTTLQSLNRLVMQSGLTIGLWKFAGVVAATTVIVFCGLWWYGFNLVPALSGSAFSAFVLPYLALKMMRGRRHKKFGAQFPDAIDIIVRSLRAGHPVPVAVQMVGREMPDPIGTEFGMVSDEITYGADLETALRNLYYRVGQDDLPLFVTAVAIQGSTGGNLSEILGNLSSVIRQRFKMRRKIKALAAEGRFSAIILSGLPIAMFLVLQVMAPDFYGQVWKIDMTKIVLSCAGGWMVMGNLIMFKLVNFRI
jgi:tight adherence protein B